ncbi:MAG: hypothetical protein ACFCVF_17580 [Kineosporiaceae bacterium]
MTLARALSRTDAAPVARRHPVLAIGSNASPAQLHDKFGDEAHSAVVPLTTVTVVGVDVSYSAHTSKAGYIPYAPIACPDRRRQMVMTWLDDDQLAVIDASERNYQPVELRGDVVKATLGSTLDVEHWTLYRSRWGVLRDGPNSSPVSAAGQGKPRSIFDSLRMELPQEPSAWAEAARFGLVAEDGLGPLVVRGARPPVAR